METYVPKVSIVIPVYKTAQFLRQCLDSVVKQTLLDIEVLVVDDCSPDNSDVLIKEYAHNDSRVKALTHKFNQGLPAARNTGMEKATGEYLIHLDSDDFWLDERMLEQLFCIARLHGSDILKFNGRAYENGRLGAELSQIKHISATSFSDEPSLWHYNRVFLYFYKRSFLAGKGIRFIPGINIGEDKIFVSAALVSANIISAVDLSFYAYRQHFDSLMARRWTAAEFRDEIEHSAIVLTTLRTFPEAQLKAIKSLITFWVGQIFPRAFEDLERSDRLAFFCKAATLIKQFDLTKIKLNDHLSARHLRFLEKVRSEDGIWLEDHFREEINGKFSRFNSSGLTDWPPYNLNQKHGGEISHTINGTIYIHAGTHNTGSSAVQEFFYHNRRQLTSEGIHYCHSASICGENAHLLPLSLVDSEIHLLKLPSLTADRIWQNIMADYHASGSRHLLLSSEFFTPEYRDNELPNLQKLKSLLGENTVRFIFYLRPQDSRLESGYRQLVKSGSRALQLKFDEYVQATLNSINYLWLLKEYEKVFGRETLIVNRYKKADFKQGDVCRDIIRVLELDSVMYSFENTIKNESWPSEVIDFIRQSNELSQNLLSIAQRDAFADFILDWFSQKNPQIAQGSSTALTPELHSQLVSYYRQSNMEVSRRYLPDNKPLIIDHCATSLSTKSDRELVSDTITLEMLLAVWRERHMLQKHGSERSNALGFPRKNKAELRGGASVGGKVFRALQVTFNRIGINVKWFFGGAD